MCAFDDCDAMTWLFDNSVDTDTDVDDELGEHTHTQHVNANGRRGRWWAGLTTVYALSRDV